MSELQPQHGIQKVPEFTTIADWPDWSNPPFPNIKKPAEFTTIADWQEWLNPLLLEYSAGHDEKNPHHVTTEMKTKRQAIFSSVVSFLVEIIVSRASEMDEEDMISEEDIISLFQRSFGLPSNLCNFPIDMVIFEAKRKLGQMEMVKPVAPFKPQVTRTHIYHILTPTSGIELGT